jgi:uncharacterized membrane protein
MMKKLLSVFLVLVLSLSMVMLPSVKAQDEAFRISDVDVDGTDLSDIDSLYINRGETINVRVEVSNVELWPLDEDAKVDGLRVKAEILGYEYDDIEDKSTDEFYIENDTTHVEHLKLNIPEDLELNDDKYKLRISVYNQQDEIQQSYDLKVRAGRHLLNIMDVIFTPGLSLDANQPLFTTVRVENLGQQKEEDIKVSVSVPQLGRTGVTYIDELTVVEDSNSDEETSESSDAIYLDLRGAQAGTYDLIVKVEYDRGHRDLTKNYQLVIGGVSAGAQNLMVESTETSKNVEAGQGIVYKVNIANLGNSARSFTAEISGLDWGNFRVDPMPVIVQAGGSSEMFVYVSPNNDVIGQKAFTVTVKEGNNVIKQFNFQANVAEARGNWDNVLTGLEIGFVVLLIILVILGIILAATRMNKKEDSEEPLGESYY